MKTKIPDLSRASTLTIEMSKIRLNGQLILFDKKVKLTPTNIEKDK